MHKLAAVMLTARPADLCPQHLPREAFEHCREFLGDVVLPLIAWHDRCGRPKGESKK